VKQIREAKRYANALLRKVGIENAPQVIAELDAVNNLMNHLSELRAILYLPDIIRIATNLYFEKKKKAKAIVMTPIEISKDYENTIKSSLKKVTERDVDIEYVIDPSLLGGLLIKVGSTMYDTSIKGQLRLLRDELIKG
jgi:F-type H+-transporting ATPase subunit delta